MRCQFHGDLKHILGEHRDPCGTIRLLEMAAGGQWRTAVKDADIVQSQEAAFKQVLAKAVFAVDPPTEIQHQFRKGALEELEIAFSRSACSVRYRKIVAQACTGGLTSLKFHS